MASTPAIVAGILVPVFILVLSAAAYHFLHKRRQRAKDGDGFHTAERGLGRRPNERVGLPTHERTPSGTWETDVPLMRERGESAEAQMPVNPFVLVQGARTTPTLMDEKEALVPNTHRPTSASPPRHTIKSDRPPVPPACTGRRSTSLSPLEPNSALPILRPQITPTRSSSSGLTPPTLQLTIPPPPSSSSSSRLPHPPALSPAGGLSQPPPQPFVTSGHALSTTGPESSPTTALPSGISQALGAYRWPSTKHPIKHKASGSLLLRTPSTAQSNEESDVAPSLSPSQRVRLAQMFPEVPERRSEEERENAVDEASLHVERYQHLKRTLSTPSVGSAFPSNIGDLLSSRAHTPSPPHSPEMAQLPILPSPAAHITPLPSSPTAGPSRAFSATSSAGTSTRALTGHPSLTASSLSYGSTPPMPPLPESSLSRTTTASTSSNQPLTTAFRSALTSPSPAPSTASQLTHSTALTGYAAFLPPALRSGEARNGAPPPLPPLPGGPYHSRGVSASAGHERPGSLGLVRESSIGAIRDARPSFEPRLREGGPGERRTSVHPTILVPGTSDSRRHSTGPLASTSPFAYPGSTTWTPAPAGGRTQQQGPSPPTSPRPLPTPRVQGSVSPPLVEGKGKGREVDAMSHARRARALPALPHGSRSDEGWSSEG